MEGTPLSRTRDPEDDFDTKKSKERRKRFLPMPEANEVSLRQSRHIAREALSHAEKATSAIAESGARLIARQELEPRQRAPEAKQLHGSEVVPLEHIGHVLVTAEATKHTSTAAMSERVQLPSDKRLDTMSRPELLSLSEQIIIEGTSLRDIYETHLIGEHALRRLLSEYFQGGDIHRALQREIVEHEIDFERDPALRDTAVPGDANDSDNQKVTAPGKEALNQLLQKAGAGIFGSEEPEYNGHNQAANNKRGPKQATQFSSQRRPVDVIMGVTIAVLVILVIGLYFWRR
jgi:hypothetical protein